METTNEGQRDGQGEELSTAPLPLHATPSEEWDEIQQAQMRAVARTIQRWQDQADLSQVAAAHLIKPYLPADLRRGATNSTLSRWRHPDRVRKAMIVVIGSIAEAFGRSMYDIADAMARARADVLAARHPGLVGDVQRQILARQQDEHDLVSDYRTLPAPARASIRIQVQSLAHAAVTQHVQQPAISDMQGTATNDPEATAGALLQETRRWQERMWDERDEKDEHERHA